jgi:glycosyltransferase involved in cell wall biosynthesis
VTRDGAGRFLPRVLYVVYWGAAEPLGRSLVLPAVQRLARLGVDLTLVTYEKPADWSRRSEMDAIRAGLDSEGVRWLPLRYHKRPKVPATLFDVAHGAARGLLARDRARFDVVHARTFVGGLMGLLLAPTLRAPLVYHNEGFYPDEQVDGGVWERGSLPHRTAGWLERRLYARAEGIIAVSERGREQIEQLPEVRRRSAPVTVVPSCVNLELFRPPAARPKRSRGLRLVYIGSVGARYMLDAIARFVAVASRELGRVELRVLTRESPDLVRSVLLGAGLTPQSFSVGYVRHETIPEELARHDAGLFFLTRGLSEHGCSPTKIGEYWACGLPVVSTANVSDTDQIIRRERVGTIVVEHSDEHYRHVLRELLALLDDSDLPRRCRRAAEDHYDLSIGCERQVELYRRILDPAKASLGKTCAA